MSDLQPCEFCGKNHDQVKRLIVAAYPARQRRTICNNCVILHMQALARITPRRHAQGLRYLLHPDLQTTTRRPARAAAQRRQISARSKGTV